MIGGAFTVWPGRFSQFCFNRGRLLRILLVFLKNNAPGRSMQYRHLLDTRPTRRQHQLDHMHKIENISICLEDLDHEVEFDDLSVVCQWSVNDLSEVWIFCSTISYRSAPQLSSAQLNSTITACENTDFLKNLNLTFWAPVFLAKY